MKRSVVIEVRAGDGLQLLAPKLGQADQRITVTLERKAGHRARLRITADEAVIIHRGAAQPVAG